MVGRRKAYSLFSRLTVVRQHGNLSGAPVPIRRNSQDIMKLRISRVPVDDRYIDVSLDELITVRPNLERISAYELDDLERWLAGWVDAVKRAKALLRERS